MGVRAERQGGTAIYTLFDKETGETVNSMDGYAFCINGSIQHRAWISRMIRTHTAKM